MLCQFPLYSKMNQIFISPLFWIFHLGHHRALCRVPCAIQLVLISYLFYTQYQQCIYINPNLPIYPTYPLSLWCPYIYSLHLCCHETFLTGKIFSIILPLAMCLFFKVLLKLQALCEPFYEQSLYCLFYSHQVIVTFFSSPPIPYWFDTFCRKFISLSLFPEPDTIDLKQFSKLSLL